MDLTFPNEEKKFIFSQELINRTSRTLQRIGRRKEKVARLDEVAVLNAHLLCSVYTQLKISMYSFFDRPDWKRWCDPAFCNKPQKEAFKLHVQSRAERYTNLMIKFKLPMCMKKHFIEKMTRIFLEKPPFYSTIIPVIQTASPFSLPDIDNPEAIEWECYRDFKTASVEAAKKETNSPKLDSKLDVNVDAKVDANSYVNEERNRKEPLFGFDEITGEQILLRPGSPDDN